MAFLEQLGSVPWAAENEPETLENVVFELLPGPCRGVQGPKIMKFGMGRLGPGGLWYTKNI